MLKVDDRIYHYLYGNGTITSMSNQKPEILVCFDEEFEVLVGEIIDNDFYFEDNRRLETTRFIEVYESNIEKISFTSKKTFISKTRERNCHLCKKLISTETHMKCEKCGWIICDCGACGCNYNKY